MFGKRSSTDNFVMNMGRKAGNIKTARAPASAPVKKIAPVAVGTGKMDDPGKAKGVSAKVVSAEPTNKGALPGFDAMKRGVTVNRNKPQPLGKTNTFKTSGKLPR